MKNQSSNKLNSIDKGQKRDSLPLDFLHVVVSASIGGILEKLFPNFPKKELPRVIGDYEFVKVFKKKTSIKPFFEYGIYKNKKGKKALAKYWQGRFKNLPYFTLKNEINIYKVLNKAQERLNKDIPEDIELVYIPKLVFSLEDKNSIIVLFEYIENSSDFSNVSTKTKVKIYMKVVDYLTFLGENLTHVERSKISVRTPFNHVVFFPFILIRSIMAHPKNTFEMLLASLVFLRLIPILLKDKRMVLSHRDLKFKNMLLKNKKIYLLDLEYCVFTNPLYELANSLCSYWNENHFDKLFLISLRGKLKNEKTSQTIFRGFLANTTIHALNDKHYTRQKMEKYMDCLSFARKG